MLRQAFPGRNSDTLHVENKKWEKRQGDKMEKELKIGTLNLNGEMWSLIKRLRLPVDAIQEKLMDKLEEGLSKLLKNGNYDIIAVQELVYSANPGIWILLRRLVKNM